MDNNRVGGGGCGNGREVERAGGWAGAGRQKTVLEQQ